ncbi:PIN domain-containing protein [Methylobacterium sp. EM32]|uniref:PIN domain-containing protein n=1 Tax=Methylobacterium sp. EM32 TaxID=3163481 RepID=UPI0033A84C68
MTEKSDVEIAPRWRPSDVLVIDTNIILSAVLGRRSLPAFEAISRKRSIATSARVAEEARRVLRGGLSDLPSDALAREEAILGGINVIAAHAYAVFLDRAARVLSDAVASRNGSASDAHVLGCAWLLDADIWSHDRDFAGTGWPSWSNANLLRPSRAPDSLTNPPAMSPSALAD